MLNIVIPMAGRGQRFADQGYTTPKPLIPVHGVPMMQLVLENLKPNTPCRFICLCLSEHIREYGIDEHLKNWAGDQVVVVEVDRVTEGAACTVLLARDYIDNDDPLMIANCDQWIDWSIDDYLQAMQDQQADGFIMTMWADDPKWSFARLDDEGNATEVVEKQVVSNEATVGIYNYAKGRSFVSAADAMIEQDLRINSEFYVAPAYNVLIAQGQRIRCQNIGKENDGMYGLGIPSDLEKFVASDLSRRAVAGIANADES